MVDGELNTGQRYQLVKFNVDGSGQVPFGGHDNLYPAWSSSNRIAFTKSVGGQNQIYVLSANGEETPLTSGATNLFPAWNPGGSKIAFTSDRDGQQEIYAMNADGSVQTCLTQNAANDTSAYWGRTAQAAGFQTLSIANATAGESESGTTELHFKVSLSAPATVPVSAPMCADRRRPPRR